MSEYFSMTMKICANEVPSAGLLRAEIEEYIAARRCEGYVAPQTITDYVLNRQDFLDFEVMNRKIGMMTKDLKHRSFFPATCGRSVGTGLYAAMPPMPKPFAG